MSVIVENVSRTLCDNSGLRQSGSKTTESYTNLSYINLRGLFYTQGIIRIVLYFDEVWSLCARSPNPTLKWIQQLSNSSIDLRMIYHISNHHVTVYSYINPVITTCYILSPCHIFIKYTQSIPNSHI